MSREMELLLKCCRCSLNLDCQICKVQAELDDIEDEKVVDFLSEIYSEAVGC